MKGVVPKNFEKNTLLLPTAICYKDHKFKNSWLKSAPPAVSGFFEGFSPYHQLSWRALIYLWNGAFYDKMKKTTIVFLTEPLPVVVALRW
jgi:hypothetical protein